MGLDLSHVTAHRHSTLTLDCPLSTPAHRPLVNHPAHQYWLSPLHRRPSLALSFTWLPDEASVRRVLLVLEATLAPFAPRPHWGTLFLMSPSTLATAYPHLGKYRTLIRKHDPAGKFSNAFIRRLVFGLSTPAEAAADDAAPYPQFGGTHEPRNPRAYSLADMLKSSGHDGAAPDLAPNPFHKTGTLQGSSSPLHYACVVGRLDEVDDVYTHRSLRTRLQQQQALDHADVRTQVMIEEREAQEAAAAEVRAKTEAERVALRMEQQAENEEVRVAARDEFNRKRADAWEDSMALARTAAAPFLADSRALTLSLTKVVAECEAAHDKSLRLADLEAEDINSLARAQKDKPPDVK